MSIHQVVALFCWNYIKAAIFKVWQQTENPTPSTDAYLKNISAKFHHDTIWNDGALGFFLETFTQEEQE